MAAGRVRSRREEPSPTTDHVSAETVVPGVTPGGFLRVFESRLCVSEALSSMFRSVFDKCMVLGTNKTHTNFAHKQHILENYVSSS